jgi:hypothetical protein
MESLSKPVMRLQGKTLAPDEHLRLPAVFLVSMPWQACRIHFGQYICGSERIMFNNQHHLHHFHFLLPGGQV